jgi:hypothetical protein
MTGAGDWVKTGPGVGYSALGYAEVGVYNLLPFPLPGLRDAIADSGDMFCSQLVDQAEQDGGCHLFHDGRTCGDVMPADLGALLGQP